MAGLVLLAAPVVLVLVAGWSRRWLNEDAYINLRVVDQVFAGHGPVFNTGERVEVATSPAWIGVLCVARATLGHLMRMEWVAVVAALAAAVAGFGVATRASRLLHAPGDLVLPLGLMLVAAVPVVWDFATSGLEMGAVWLWTAGCWLVLVSAARRAEPPTGRPRAVSLVVLGLGPLIRPDLAVIAAALLVTWWVIVRPDRRRLALDVAVAAAIPVAYQVFRMGFYASLVPNTALAKDAGGLHLRQGLTYLGDLVTTYWLAVPLAVIAVATGLTIARADRNVRAACIGMVVAAVAHAGYITVAGGDYMHGRLLLPALFAFALPASIVLGRRDLLVAGLVVAGAAWAVVCAGTLRFREEPTAAMLPDIIDFRDRNGIQAGVVHVEGPSEGYLSPVEIAELDAAGRTGYIRVLADEVVPAGTGGRLVVVFGSIGVPSYRTGIDVWVVDLGGLGEPLAARAPVIPGRPAGHRKQIDPAWHEARWGVEQPDDPGAAAAARDAMACGPIRDLLNAVTEPMTPGRFLRNAWSSVRFTTMEVPDDPRDAAPCR
ncbi:MAG TPA: hypothetical protein VFM27_01895 [Acidimicrobiales bacterium]|nr:hypothetical protein [Acidimicrobiales bacterium]